MALLSVRVTCSWPTTSSNPCGRHLRARIWYVIGPVHRNATGRSDSTVRSPLRSKKEDQAGLRHPGGSPYRCFLPDLAGFEVSCRTGPGLLLRYGQRQSQIPPISRSLGPGMRASVALRKRGLAERGGFEPPRKLLAPYTISSRAPSAGLGHLSQPSVRTAVPSQRS